MLTKHRCNLAIKLLFKTQLGDFFQVFDCSQTRGRQMEGVLRNGQLTFFGRSIQDFTKFALVLVWEEEFNQTQDS